jgi:hypothetical protein
MTDLYYLLILLLLLGIGYYSIKYLFFVFVGMSLGFYISYKYLSPIFCSFKKINT